MCWEEIKNSCTLQENFYIQRSLTRTSSSAKMRSSSFPEIPVSPSICHRTDFENIRSTTTDERMSEGEPLDWPLSCPDRLQGEEHLVPPPHLCRWWVSVGVNRQLLTYWRPTMCKAQWELQAWDLFTPSPAPLQLLCHTHTHKKIPSRARLSVCFCG